jgi:anaerobic selenocysteine-containing dehydrogenase
MKIITTACPRNCYSTCTFRVSVRNGKIGLIEPHPDNLATAEGICLKGLIYAEREYHPDRLLHPLKKRDDQFEKISWEEALDLIESQIKRIHNKFGQKSILYYSGSGTKGLLNSVGSFFWKKIGGYTTAYGDLCWPAGLEATRLTLGENKHNAPWDIENAKLIIMWGKNAAETNIHQMKFIEQAISNGAKYVVIDPRRTEPAERAHLLIQPRPGTDGALALGLANILIESNSIDNDFINKHVLGFDEFSQHVKKFTLKTVSDITDIPEDQIVKLAKLIGQMKPMTITAGYGMQRYTNSGQTMRALISLLAITGNIGKPGAGWVYANLQSHIFDTIKDPIAFFPPEVEKDNVRISISTAKLGRDILETTDPPIKMIWVERGNPVTQNPDTNTVLKAFRSVDFRVVVDQFLTDTAREADLVLPSKTMFEQADVINAYWHPYIQYKAKVIDPPGEVKPESEIYYLLAQRFGISEYEMQNNIPAANDDAVEEFLIEKLKPFPELNLDALKKGPVLAPGNEEVAFSDFIFPTPSGKIEIYSDEAKNRWNSNPLPDFEEAEESSKSGKYKFNLMTPNTKNRIHSQFNNLKLIEQFINKPMFHLHPNDAAEYKINDGDIIRVFNDRGELKGEVKFDFGLKPGCVLMTNGWWISQGGTVNFLSNGKETDMGYGAAFHDTMVDIEKINNK